MAEITRNLIVPFIDTAQKATAESATGATFVPIDLSTTFELGYNAVTDTKSYICYKNDTNTLTGFQPAMDQEIALDSTNPMWKFIEGLRRKMPVGADAKFPVLNGLLPAKAGALRWEEARLCLGISDLRSIIQSQRLRGDRQIGRLRALIDSLIAS